MHGKACEEESKRAYKGTQASDDEQTTKPGAKLTRFIPIRCRIYKPTICSGLRNKYITIYIAIISIISFYRFFFTQIQLGKTAFIIAQKPFLKGLLYTNYTITGLGLQSINAER